MGHAAWCVLCLCYNYLKFVISTSSLSAPYAGGGASLSRQISEFNNEDWFWYLYASRLLCTVQCIEIRCRSAFLKQGIRDGQRVYGGIIELH